MSDQKMIFSKTYKDTDWGSEVDTYEPKPKVSKKKTRRPQSKKELIDAIEEGNDGYIYEEADELDRR